MSETNEKESATMEENPAVSDKKEEIVPIQHSNYVPTQVEKWLQCLDFNDAGHLLLGASNLTGRYWVGSLWYFTEPEPSASVSVSSCLTGVERDNGIGDALFLREECAGGGDEDKMKADMLVSLDNGSIDHISLSYQNEEGGASFYFLEHLSNLSEQDDVVTAMVKTADKSTLLTSSYDKSIVAWDLPTLARKHKFSGAHGDLVLGVDPSRSQPDVFVSAGQDGFVATWDLRAKASKGIVMESSSVNPTCVYYVPKGGDTYIVVGNVAGELHLRDIRMSDISVAVESSFGEQIHKLRFANESSNLFAACADSSTVRVFDVIDNSSFLLSYEDDRHADFVRGLAWNPRDETLWSCGWDKQLLRHSFK